MDQETLELMVLSGMCLTGSYLIMREFRAYIDTALNRRQGESWGDVWKRAEQEHELNKQAQLEMFGSKWKTLSGRLCVMAVLLSCSWAMVFMPAAVIPVLAYFGLGAYVTRKNIPIDKQIYGRLLKRDRLTCRILYATLWPIYRPRSEK